MRIVLQKPSQTLEVGARLDEPHDRHEGIRVDQRIKWDVVEIELAGNGDQDAVGVVFDQSSVGADAELAAQDDVESVGQGTPGLIAELQAR